MSIYLVNFIVYTAAMIGIIFLAVFVYKKCSVNTISKSKFLNIEECITIAPRKNLYVVRAGSERFLVASDVGRTSLISKLGVNENTAYAAKQDSKCSVDELPEIIKFPQNSQHSSKKVFKNIINNL